MTRDGGLVFYSLYPVSLLLLLTLPIITCQVDQGFSLGAEVSCVSPPGYDITNLTIGIWSFASDKNCIGTNGSTKASCLTFLSFCKPLENLKNITNCDKSSVCVQTFNGTGRNETVERGSGRFDAQPFKNDVISMTGGFVATFPEDGGYRKKDGSICNISTTFDFYCNLLASWVPSASNDIEKIPDAAQLTASFDENTCKYHLTAGYAGACLQLQPAKKIESLSAGSVLIIIFFVSLTAYFLIGGVVNYCRGYRGRELIPQAEFWIDLPVLVADGILYTCRGCKPETSTYESI